jgi:hypothetical protein
MMSRRPIAILAIMFGMTLPGIALAEEDYMEVQRCVWRCLADSPGAESAEYNQCVAAKCNETVAVPAAPGPAPSAALSAVPPWIFGATGDGQGRYAGQVAAETGNNLYYTCDASGVQNLLLSGEVEGPSAILSVDVDGQVFGLFFEQSPGGYTARLEPGSPVPEMFMRAELVHLRNEAGWSLGRFSMAGADLAIAGARAACGL